ncbi:MAG: hypothetical protein QOG64_1371, partial [Acidimicrobiaceae bacterium]|nr:hypothetical protein [Acidimicrobiaceae bacterium]
MAAMAISSDVTADTAGAAPDRAGTIAPDLEAHRRELTGY